MRRKQKANGVLYILITKHVHCKVDLKFHRRLTVDVAGISNVRFVKSCTAAEKSYNHFSSVVCLQTCQRDLFQCAMRNLYNQLLLLLNQLLLFTNTKPILESASIAVCPCSTREYHFYVATVKFTHWSYKNIGAPLYWNSGTPPIDFDHFRALMFTGHTPMLFQRTT